jgi:hypothetical protein
MFVLMIKDKFFMWNICPRDSSELALKRQKQKLKKSVKTKKIIIIVYDYTGFLVYFNDIKIGGTLVCVQF